MTYTIQYTVSALDALRGLDGGIRKTILKKVRGLEQNPEQQGKALIAQLAGFRSIQTAGRYRIIYTIEDQKVLVTVVSVGIRKEGDKKDVYALAKKLVCIGLLDVVDTGGENKK